MNAPQNRRDFLNNVGKGVLATALGPALLAELGLGTASAAEEAAAASGALNFGALEPLVCFMQETPIAKLQSALVAKIKEGIPLDRLVAAGALANARTFGGEDYIGFHTIMALAPALHMSRTMPAELAALPVFKVLYRNTNRIQEFGGRAKEVLHPVTPAPLPAGADAAEELKKLVKAKNTAGAEALFASLSGSPDAMLTALLPSVEEDQEVHRTVLPYRAWDLLPVVGRDHAHTLLRQSLRYCLKAESWRSPEWEKSAQALAKLLSDHHLPRKEQGTKPMTDAQVEELARVIFATSPMEASTAAAKALADGFDPAGVGEAISLAANQLLLRDHGRLPSQETNGKPIGSVHGDSIGVHASDSANAWRNLARVSDPRSTCACLIMGAWQASEDRSNRGGDFLSWEALPMKRHISEVKSDDPAELLKQLDEAIRGNLQARACGIVHHYGTKGLPEKPVFDALLRYAISEDGALHAEKYFRTVSEEFAATRPALRWRHLAGLARVTASEFGRPAPGYAESREVLGLGRTA
ncbi:MAG TPA: hypothetical protein VG796_27975 [Verrucomicrobiales bacterium]|nr:hypothetical protein [Verrucomicrobiales bacterium]